MIFRVTLQITNGAIGKITTEDKDGSFSSDYSGNHIAIFECDVKVPPALALIDHSFKEYIMAHRLNFRNWRLVDLDNYMNGNPHFTDTTTHEDW